MQTRPQGANALLERRAGFTRVAWFVGLWLAGVMTMATVAYLIRWAVGP
jgi:hypothetical protein